MIESPETSQSLPSTNEPLTERQHAAVALLVSGKTYSAVAEELGIDRRTLWEWRQTPAFFDAVEAELTAIRTETRARMSALASKAVTAVEGIIENGYTDAEKLAAIRLVFKWLNGERVQGW